MDESRPLLTLVIVVSCLALLVAIVVPNFVHDPETSSKTPASIIFGLLMPLNNNGLWKIIKPILIFLPGPISVATLDAAGR